MDIEQILIQAGSSGLIGLMFLAFLYFDSKKKRETLVIKDEDRKDDTDEVARELNHVQDISLGRIDERLRIIETNHLPHLSAKLETLEGTNNQGHTKIEVAIAKLEGKIDILLDK